MSIGRNALLATLLTASIAASLLVAEWIILPWSGAALPRRVQLMGFYATPGTLVDDTQISAIGFAGDAVSVTKPAGTLRILTLGGSAMFNRRMAERLKYRLAWLDSRPIEVVGAALRTHTSMSSVLKYELLARCDFDFVLIYHGINDLWANHVEAQRFEDDYGHLGAAYERNLFLDHSLILRRLYSRLLYDKKVPYASPRRRQENGAGWASERSFRRNLERLVRDVRRDGAVPILMTFAWSIPESYTLERFLAGTVGYVNPDHYDRFGAELWGSPSYVREGLARHNTIVRAVAAEQEVALIDQEMLIGKELKWFGDICHFNEDGTERFLYNITKYFQDRQWIQPRAATRGRSARPAS